MCDRETYYQQVNPVEVSLRDYHMSPVSLGRVLILIPNVYVRPEFFFFHPEAKLSGFYTSILHHYSEGSYRHVRS